MAQEVQNGSRDGAAGREPAEWERAQVELKVYLDEDAVAGGVLKCWSEGIVKRREIAQALGVSVQTVTAARKRLERKARQVLRAKVA
jgi:hypothetical protein